MPTSRPRSFSACARFCASQPARPPHFRTSRTRFVSSNSSDSEYSGSRKNGTRSTVKPIGRPGTSGSRCTAAIALLRCRFPMNPFGHIVSETAGASSKTEQRQLEIC